MLNVKPRNMRAWLACSLLLLLGMTVTPAFAAGPGVSPAADAPEQSAPETVVANTPFQAAADHDGVETTSYRLYVNGAIKVEVPASARVGTIVTFNVAGGLPKGDYVLYAEAVGPGGRTAGNSMNLTVTPGPPAPPTGLRIVR